MATRTVATCRPSSVPSRSLWSTISFPRPGGVLTVASLLTTFRRDRLYNEEMNMVFLEKCDELFTIFIAYCRSSQLRLGLVVGEHTPHLMCEPEFAALCKVSGLYDGSGSGTSFINCRVAFCCSQMTVIDELRRSGRRARLDTHTQATFVEFLEALRASQI